MTVEQYQGLLRFVLGVSFFLIMFLALRLLSVRKNNADNKNSIGSNLWFGVEELIIKNIIVETPNIKTFVFARGDNKMFPYFKPGQFLSFQIGEEAKIVRSYSISSSPNNSRTVQVTIKHLKDGVGSSWFHNKKIGDKVLAMPPSGHFFDDQLGNADRVYIAGGVGITPLLSMLQKNLEDVVNFRIYLFYGARTTEDLAFHELLLHYSKRFKNFQYFWYLSDDTMSKTKMLTFNSVKEVMPDLNKAQYYLCGPSPMADGIINELKNSGVNEDNIFNEKFISPTTLNPDQLPVRQLKLKFGEKVFQYNSKDNVLAYLESQGENLSYACRTGVCGSCKCKIKGPYKALTDSGLSRLEKKEGYTLACVSYPEGDIEVES